MARKAVQKKKTIKKAPAKQPVRRIGVVWRVILAGVLSLALSIGVYAVVPPPTTPYILAEGVRLGGVRREWVPLEDISPNAARTVVAAEDADFCLHWGFDMRQLRYAIESGASRGASTLTQQTVKNVWLWQGRSWPRKALEALMTPVVELLWSKRRIVEVYLNMVEFDTGVFGIEAAAQHHFGVSAKNLSMRQAALLAAVLPNPKEREAINPSASTDRRARSIADGAATILYDGRSACFE